MNKTLCPASGQPYDPELLYMKNRRVMCSSDDCWYEWKVDASGTYPEHEPLTDEVIENWKATGR